MDTQAQITALQKEVKELREMLEGRGNSARMSDKMRSLIFVDQDNTSVRTQVAVADLVTGNVTVGKIPDLYARVYVSGQAYNLPLHNLT